MSDFRDRFLGMEPEERDRLVAELESHVTVRAVRLLETREIEELLTLLPAAYFRLAFRAGVGNLSRQRDCFPERVLDFGAAVSSVVGECQRQMASSDEQARKLFLEKMALLRLVHPALWYRVYDKVRIENLGWALELEPADRGKPFKRP